MKKNIISRVIVNKVVDDISTETKLPEAGELVFKDYETLKAFALKQQEEDIWESQPVNGLEIIPVGDYPIFAQDVITKYGLAMDEDAMREFMECDGYLLKAAGKVMPLRYTAIRGMRDRAGLNGSAYSVLTRDETAMILNTCYHRWGNKCLILKRDGAIGAMHSGDENDYSPLPMGSLLEIFEEETKAAFSGCEYEGGFMSHEFCGASFRVKDANASKAFAAAIRSLGYDEKDVTLYVRFSSSDVALCGANLAVLMKAGGVTMQIGNALSLTHKLKHSVDDFRQNCQKVHALYKDGAERMDALTHIFISHPIGCLKGVAKKLGIPKKYFTNAEKQSLSLLDTIEVNISDQPTAFEIYYYLWNIISEMKNSDASNKQIVDMQENLTRALYIDWKEFDCECEW